MRRLLPWLWAGFLLLAGSAPAAGLKYGDIIIPRIPSERNTISFMPQALFPHWIHRTEFRCYVCHDKIFKMKRGGDRIDMDAVRSGQYCGKCHNGKTAFAIGFDTCERCHKAPTTQGGS